MAFGIALMAFALMRCEFNLTTGNGVNLQPSYYNNGNVSFGWVRTLPNALLVAGWQAAGTGGGGGFSFTMAKCEHAA